MWKSPSKNNLVNPVTNNNEDEATFNSGDPTITTFRRSADMFVIHQDRRSLEVPTSPLKKSTSLDLAGFRDDPLRVCATSLANAKFILILPTKMSSVDVDTEIRNSMNIDHPNALLDAKVLELANAMNIDYSIAEQAVAQFDGDVERAAEYLLANAQQQ